MPLIKSKSKKAFESNLKEEMHAGKPQDQALAIAYSVQRHSKAKKMAQGGMVAKEMPAKDPQGLHEHSHEEHYESIADAILAKKHKAMADQRDSDLLEANAIEPHNEMDRLNYDLRDEERLGDHSEESALEDMDYDHEGDQIGDKREKDEEDEHDMVSSIMKKRKSKK